MRLKRSSLSNRANSSKYSRELCQRGLPAIHQTPYIALLRVVEQRHETEVHVKLLMAVKESQARIIGDKINFQLLIAS